MANDRSLIGVDFFFRNGRPEGNSVQTDQENWRTNFDSSSRMPEIVSVISPNLNSIF